MITGKNFIGNELSALGNNSFKTFNPKLNKENNITFFEATKEEVDNAVYLASQAFKKYQLISGKQKAKFLNTIADEILNLGNYLIETYTSETGLSKERAYKERDRTIFQLTSFANLIDNGTWVNAEINTGNPKRKPVSKPDIRKMNIPIGPVVVFGASNFPLAYSTAGGDTASALAAGCPVIVKSHPLHAGTGELVASTIIKAIKKTKMPNGIFSNLNASRFEVGQQLTTHPIVKAIGFTGSFKGGTAILNLASKRKEPIPVFAEMGSINPVILLPKSIKNNTEELTTNYAKSITSDAGQFCTNPGLILGIKNENLTSFSIQLANKITQKTSNCMLHPNIYTLYENNKSTIAKEKNVHFITKDIKTPPNYALQTIAVTSGENFLNNTKLHQEVFGPFSLIVECKDYDQLELIISKLEGQLTGTIIFDDNEIKEYPTLISTLQNKVGRIIFNGVPTGVEVCSAMVHGGPFPASTDSRFTAVGVNSIKRWVRPVSFQNCPNDLLPDELKNENPLNILRSINDNITSKKLF